jgi:acyl-coenzyme A synthetase/AMP-(fatty) acid ligase
VSSKFFFNSIEKFESRPAFFDQSGIVTSFSTLAKNSDDFAQGLISRQLVFCMASNTSDFLTAYVGFMRQKIVPLLLSKEITFESLLDKINAYKPMYIFLPNSFLLVPNEYILLRSRGAYDLYWKHDRTNELHPDLSLLMTTSGSTGNSKLVRLSALNIESNSSSINEYMKLTSKSRAITTLPFNYSYGLSIIHSHLAIGGSVVLNEHSITDPKFWEIFSGNGITHLGGVPFTYEILKRFHSKLFSNLNLRTLTQAGGKLSSELAIFFANECSSRSIDFFIMYGQTEATARMSYLEGKDVLQRPKSIGKEIPSGVFSLIDDNGELIHTPEIEGQLIYTGPNVSLGYSISRSDLNEGDTNFGELQTGDLAMRDQFGFYYITGRMNRLAKINGIRINLQELDDFLETLNYSAASSSDDMNVFVFIEGKPIDQLLEKEIIKFMNLRKGIIILKEIERIPRTGAGKVDYTQLASWTS